LILESKSSACVFESLDNDEKEQNDEEDNEDEIMNEPQMFAPEAPSTPSRVAPRFTGGYEQLVGKQQFTGSWDIQSIAQVANVPAHQILHAKPDGLSEDVWATACGIALLEVVWSSSKAIWGMVAKKARVFIVKELSKQGISAAEATTKAEEIIKAAEKEMK